MECPSCKTETFSDQRYCPQCGVALPPSSVPAVTPDGRFDVLSGILVEKVDSGIDVDEEVKFRMDLTLFIRKNVDIYLDLYDENFRESGSRWFICSWHWPAFFVPLLWLLYRKLYLWAAVFLFASYLTIFSLSLVVSEGVATTIGQLVIPAILAIFAKRIYINHALQRIRKADERNLTLTERDAYLERAGGVSIPGAVFGCIVLFSMIVLPHIVNQ